MRPYLIGLLFLIPMSLFGQEDSSLNKVNAKTIDTTYKASDDFNITAFPLVFYLPETSLAFGCSWNYGF